jgi:hypothetical protein
MSATIGIRGIAFERPAAVAREHSPDRFVLALTALGIAAGLIVHFTMAEAAEAQFEFEPDQLFKSAIAKPGLYYAAHATEILLLMAAGLTALFSTKMRLIERGYLARFSLLIAAAMFMSARGYSPSDWLSTRLVDIGGPFPFMISVLVFVGARRGNWVFLGKMMAVMAVLFSIGAFVGMAKLRTLDRDEAILNLGGALNALYWPAAFIALREYPAASAGRRLRFIPILIYGLGSVFTQTRLNIVMLLGLLMVYAYIQYKRRQPQAAVWFTGIMLAVWLTLFTAAFLRDSRAVQNLLHVTDAFSDRLEEDTRTGQIMWFFRDVKPTELILGRGSFAKWQWGPNMYTGTDVGYLSLLFYGGVPLMLMYVLTHITPGFAVLQSRYPTWQLTAAGIVALYSVRMLSSTYPFMSVDYYPVLLCVGACISRDTA